MREDYVGVIASLAIMLMEDKSGRRTHIIVEWMGQYISIAGLGGRNPKKIQYVGCTGDILVLLKHSKFLIFPLASPGR